MKKIVIILLSCCLSMAAFAQTSNWKAKRITAKECQNESNTWIDFRKDIVLKRVPAKALAKIACDSKYWLWVNGEMAVFEGQLNQGTHTTMKWILRHS